MSTILRPTYVREQPEVGQAFYRAVLRNHHERIVAACIHHHQWPYKRQPFAPLEEHRIPAMDCAGQVLLSVLRMTA